MNRTILAFVVVLGILTGRQAAAPPSPTPALPVSEPIEATGDMAARPMRSAGPDTAPQPSAPARTARELAQTFAAQQANWSWKTIARQYQRLSAMATGPLAQQLRDAMTDARLDRTLQRDRAGSRGRILGIDIQGAGDRRRIIAATREDPYRNAATDLTGQRSRVYLGVAQRTPAGWLMSAWEPQP